MTTEPDFLKGSFVDLFLVDDPVSASGRTADELDALVRKWHDTIIPEHDQGMVGPFLLSEEDTDYWREEAKKLRERRDLTP